MKFIDTTIPGVYLLEMERRADERGHFARIWCEREFTAHGLNPKLAQCSASYNLRCGTLRGMHYQAPPHAEAKLVRCTRGAIFDVALDLRPDSPAYCRWIGFDLSPDNGRMLYIPEGCAHGFQSLEDGSEVLYLISTPFEPAAARGARWDDPAFTIRWPITEPILSDKDRSWPLIAPPKQ